MLWLQPNDVPQSTCFDEVERLELEHLADKWRWRWRRWSVTGVSVAAFPRDGESKRSAAACFFSSVTIKNVPCPFQGRFHHGAELIGKILNSWGEAYKHRTQRQRQPNVSSDSVFIRPLARVGSSREVLTTKHVFCASSLSSSSSQHY